MSQQERFAVVDFEATGLSASDRIVEIGVVLLDHNLEIESTWDTLVSPKRDIPNSFVHKLTAADVKNAPSFEGIAAKFASLIAGRTVVAHNASFEERFMRQEFSRLGVRWPDYGSWIVDTAALSKKFLNKSQLNDVLEEAGIVNENPHHALADALSIAQLLSWLIANDPDLVLNNKPLAIWPSGLPAAETELPRTVATGAQTPWLSQLVKCLPDVAGTRLRRYRATLFEVLTDKDINSDEQAKLDSVIAEESLDIADVQALHRATVRQLTLAAKMDGHDTHAAIETIQRLACKLDVDPAIVEEVLTQRSQPAVAPLLQLQAGDSIAFAGNTEFSREELSSRATSAGLIVGEVSKLTKVLVASDPESNNAKAQKARDNQVPIVGESEFASILNALVKNDTHSNYEFDFGQVNHAASRLNVIFPWFESASREEATPAAVTKAWIRRHPNEPLHEISPLLTAESTIDINREGMRVLELVSEDFPNILLATTEQLAASPAIGKLKLRSVVSSIVYAAIDGSEQYPLDSPSVDHLAQETESFHAQPATPAETDECFTDAELKRIESEVQRRVDHLMHEKFKAISLGMGWISLHNDSIPTRELIDLPKELSHYLSDMQELINDYSPTRTVFAAAVEELRDAAQGDPRKLAIIERRWIGGMTLEELSADFGISSEQVRQLEMETRQAFNKHRSIYDAVLGKIERFINPAVRLDTLRRRFSSLSAEALPFEVAYGDLFTALEGEWVIRDGWVFSPSFEDDVQRVLSEEKNQYGVADKKAVTATLGIKPRIFEEYVARELNQKVIIIGDQIIVDAETHNSRAVALLSIIGKPLTVEEIQRYLGVSNARTAGEQYAADPRMFKVSEEQWGLSDWNTTEYRTVSAWIRGVVTEEAKQSGRKGVPSHGVSINYLLSQARHLQILAEDVHDVVSSPEFEVIDEYVFRATPPSTV